MTRIILYVALTLLFFSGLCNVLLWRDNRHIWAEHRELLIRHYVELDSLKHELKRYTVQHNLDPKWYEMEVAE